MKIGPAFMAFNLKLQKQKHLAMLLFHQQAEIIFSVIAFRFPSSSSIPTLTPKACSFLYKGFGLLLNIESVVIVASQLFVWLIVTKHVPDGD